MATLVDRSSWFVLAAVWCVACSDGFASSSKGSPSKPDDGAGTGPAAGDPGGSGATGGAGGSGGVGGGRSPSNGKLGGSTGLPTGGTSTGGSGSDTSTGGSDTGAGGSTAATGGSDTSAGGSGPATGGSGPSAGGSSNQGGSDNGGSTSSGATGGSGGNAASAGMGGSGPQAGSGSGAAPGQGGGSSSAGGSGGSSMAAGAPNSTGGSAPIGGCDNQLLANADFEAGPSSAWTEQSSWPGIEIIVKKDNADLVAEGVAPYGGNYLGWLGGIPDNEWDHEYVKLTQSVTLPSTAATLTLTGRRYIKSVDDPSEAFDVAYLEFATEADDLAWQAQEWTNQDTTNGWVPFTATTDVEPQYRGKKLVFVAYSNTDPGGQTSFFIDDLRLVAGCGR